MIFEWDKNKEQENTKKHGVDFEVEGEVLTVRFTHREDVIRIFGAGYWRKGRILYEQENPL